jgi:hypothetical protein
MGGVPSPCAGLALSLEKRLPGDAVPAWCCCLQGKAHLETPKSLYSNGDGDSHTRGYSDPLACSDLDTDADANVSAE